MPKKLKQRIVGLLVLGALTAIIVPILLDISQSNQSNIIASPIPEKPDGFIVKRLSLDLPEKLVVLDEAPNPVEHSDVSHSTKVTENKKQIESIKIDSQPLVPKDVSDVKKSLVMPQAWVVQLASFSKEKNALMLRDKLKKAGYRAFIERIDIVTGEKFRVKVGPELSKSVTKNLQADLMDEFQLKGVVVKHLAGTSVVTAGE